MYFLINSCISNNLRCVYFLCWHFQFYKRLTSIHEILFFDYNQGYAVTRKGTDHVQHTSRSKHFTCMFAQNLTRVRETECSPPLTLS